MCEAETYPLNVRIVDYSKAGLVPDKLLVFYRKKGENVWNNKHLEKTKTHEIYRCELTAEKGDTIEYYVSATDNSGRTEKRPYPAPDGFYSFTVK